MPKTAQHTAWSRTILIAIGGAIAVGVVALAFLWPSVTSNPQDLPVAVTGPSAQVDTVTSALQKQANGTFDLTKVDDRAAALDGIHDRTYDGAIVLGKAPEVLTASAASPIVTQIMTGVQGQLQTQVDGQLKAARAQAAQAAIAAGAPADQAAKVVAEQIPSVKVALTDVAPFASTDSRGSGMTAAAFPLTLGGIIGGIVISILVTGVWRRLSAAVIYAIGAGLAIVSVMQPWLGILQGDYLMNVGVIALSLFATGAFILGMTALIGTPGIAVGSVITMLIGNPLASAAAPWEFIPQPWGEAGQWLVPGASTTLLRDVSYFPDANPMLPFIALGGWAVLGILLSIFGHFRTKETVHIDNWDEEDITETHQAHVAAPAPASAHAAAAANAAAAAEAAATSAAAAAVAADAYATAAAAADAYAAATSPAPR